MHSMSHPSIHFQGGRINEIPGCDSSVHASVSCLSMHSKSGAMDEKAGCLSEENDKPAELIPFKLGDREM